MGKTPKTSSIKVAPEILNGQMSVVNGIHKSRVGRGDGAPRTVLSLTDPLGGYRESG